jgi:hypothetical protein
MPSATAAKSSSQVPDQPALETKPNEFTHLILVRGLPHRTRIQDEFVAVSASTVLKVKHLSDGAGDTVEAPWPMRCPPSQLSSMKRNTEV